MNRDFYKLLGQRIRERRKELKLTQSAVCGSYMTRNMLSSIENGSAHPSLDTLIYIADKLNMPAEYFMSRDSTIAALYRKIESIDKIRTLFETKQYKRCVDMCEDVQISDSEIYLIVAESELRLAFECLMKSKLKSASDHLEKCERYADSCIYNSDRIKATAQFFKQLIDCVRDNRYPSASFFKNKRTILVEEEFIVFIYALSMYDKNGNVLRDTVESVSDPLYKSYLQAQYHISLKEYEHAKPYLHNIISAEPGFFTRYFTVHSLELCYKETDDYKNAYEYARKRLELIDKFND